jgi:hypothetical protein
MRGCAPSDSAENASGDFGSPCIKVEPTLEADTHEWPAALGDSAHANGDHSPWASGSVDGEWEACDGMHDAEVDMVEVLDEDDPAADAAAFAAPDQPVDERACAAMRELSDWIWRLPVCEHADATVVGGVIRALIASEATLSILADFAVSELVEIGVPADFARAIHDAVLATDPHVNPLAWARPKR